MYCVVLKKFMLTFHKSHEECYHAVVYLSADRDHFHSMINGKLWKDKKKIGKAYHTKLSQFHTSF